ncbi:aminoacyl-tRNA deacylase [Floricoccus tropicus]|uniref:Cys-tRNA(Pro)/Cys-tRNA(Cys) deacylase n=1 Tax=Floricoccus tropicus TaxID=1859473 RepID=A0A1E8GME3_9LACT|nr:aminoacyl-tRNA deacylase [Floricoccus tropicus]OFI48688.1 aminoacyl-tRNA deacylase [Floricoccus tropicus]
MAKKKHKKTLVEQILDKAGIAHIGLEINALEGEKPDNVSEDDIYKTLALIGNNTGPVIGIIPITQHLSYKKLATASGNKKVAMIPLKDLQKTTGYIHGANNPVGIWQTKKFPIFIDKVAQDKEFMIVSAGEVGKSIQINPQDLANFVNAEFSDLIE